MGMPEELKESTHWRDRHRDSVTGVREEILSRPGVYFVSGCSVFSGYCIMLLRNAAQEAASDALSMIGETAGWSAATFVSCMAVGYLCNMCSRQNRLHDEQEIKIGNQR